MEREKIEGPRFSERELLSGSHFEGSSEEWERQRRWIASAIDRDGTILDIGCANGYLLKSLQDWSDHELDPYGVDMDPKTIKAAQELFPGREKHFVQIYGDEAPEDFPKEFDLVYWNVWDNADFDQEYIRILLGRASEMSFEKGGRLILGFYHPDSNENERKIQQLTDMGFMVERIETPPDLPERGVFIDQKSVQR